MRDFNVSSKSSSDNIIGSGSNNSSLRGSSGIYNCGIINVNNS